MLLQLRVLLATQFLLPLACALVGLGNSHAQAVSGQGTWETTLQARDIGNTGTTNAFYDTALNITWLANANVNGVMNWDAANDWASNLNVGGLGGWRLPSALNQDGLGPCAAANCSGSELGYLWYAELGNVADPGTSFIANKGNFKNVQMSGYWYSTAYSPNQSFAWYFDTRNAGQWMNFKTTETYAMAVHTGDVGTVVASVPEPEPYAMLLAGLGFIGAAARRRPVGSASRQTLIGTSFFSVSAIGHSG